MGTSIRVLIRVELIKCGRLYGESVYNTVVTAHGLMIIFFAVMPLIIGFFGN